MSEINEKKLEITGTIKEGIGIGMKNIGPIFVNVLLWTLTSWIPYINIGTTIGLSVGIVAKLSRGEEISITEIFDPKYRKYMGEFFLTSGIVAIGVSVGMVLFVIPGMVLSIAWYFAAMLTVDKEKNPMEAISLSNKITYGNKGRIFGIIFIPGIIYGIIAGIISGIGAFTGSIAVIVITALISLVLTFFIMFILVGIQASLYRQLAGNVQN